MVCHHKETGRLIPVAAVIVTEFKIPCWDLVMLFVKFSFAAIPAAIIIFCVWCVIYAMAGASILELLNR